MNQDLNQYGLGRFPLQNEQCRIVILTCGGVYSHHLASNLDEVKSMQNGSSVNGFMMQNGAVMNGNNGGSGMEHQSPSKLNQGNFSHYFEF